MGKPRHADTLPSTVTGGPHILVSALVLHEPSSLGKTQAEHYDHPTLGPPHRPKMEANPRGGLDTDSSHPLLFDTSQGHMPTIYNECTHPSPARPRRGTSGTPAQNHAPLSVPPTKKGEQKKCGPQTQSPHHKRDPSRQRRQRRKRMHQP